MTARSKLFSFKKHPQLDVINIVRYETSKYFINRSCTCCYSSRFTLGGHVINCQSVDQLASLQNKFQLNECWLFRLYVTWPTGYWFCLLRVGWSGWAHNTLLHRLPLEITFPFSDIHIWIYQRHIDTICNK